MAVSSMSKTVQRRKTMPGSQVLTKPSRYPQRLRYRATLCLRHVSAVAGRLLAIRCGFRGSNRGGGTGARCRCGHSTTHLQHRHQVSIAQLAGALLESAATLLCVAQILVQLFPRSALVLLLRLEACNASQQVLRFVERDRHHGKSSSGRFGGRGSHGNNRRARGTVGIGGGRWWCGTGCSGRDAVGIGHASGAASGALS